MTNDESKEGQATEPGGEAAQAAAATEPEAAERPAPQPASETEALRAEFETEITRLKDQLLRALAEVENTRRRADREREDTAKYAISGFARDVLTVADNLRRALENIPAHAREKDELLNTLAVGVEATERQLTAAFERHGIRRIDPMGEPFDHNFHQAMFEAEDTGKPPGTVVQVMQAGYVINGRLLRPALVAIAKAGPAEAHVDTTV